MSRPAARNGSEMQKTGRTMPKKKSDPDKRRTRYEPPTLQEAIVAAQGLADDVEGQVSIAAQLMGLPESEVRPAVLQAKTSTRMSLTRLPPVGTGPAREGFVRTNVRSQRTVVVERRNLRPTSFAPRAPAE